MEQNGFNIPSYRHKKAMLKLKSVIENLNPIPFSKKITGRKKTRYNEFLDFLTPEMKDVAKSMEKEYFYKQRHFLSKVLSSHNRNKWSVYYKLFK